MVLFTNGELKSAKHRVVPPPGEQVKYVRHSLEYFLRPNDQMLMKPIDQFIATSSCVHDERNPLLAHSRVYNAAEWMVKRAAQMGAWDSNLDGKLDERSSMRSKI